MLNKMMNALREHAVRRSAEKQTRRELGNLTRRDLDDIGLSFSSIESVSREAGEAAVRFYRERNAREGAVQGNPVAA